MEQPTPKAKVTVRAGQGDRQYLRDLWVFRELLFFLAWRDVAVRYKQSVLGVSWAVLRPVLTMLVFTFVFRRLGGFPSEGLPYPIVVFAALLPWQFFSSGLQDSSASLVGNSNLVTKVYFPRILVPVAALSVCAMDLLISLGILGVLMAWYDILPTWRLLALPGFFGLAVIASMGFGIWLSALNVRYRDVRFIVPFIVQFGLYISPVGYLVSVVPEELRPMYCLNPMVGVIEGFRWAILGKDMDIHWPGFVAGQIAVLGLVWIGLRYFRRTERILPDVI